MSGQQLTPPSLPLPEGGPAYSSPSEVTRMSYPQPVELSDQEPPGLLRGGGKAMAAGAELGTSPTDFDPLILENINFSVREFAEILLLHQEFNAPPLTTNFPTFEPEQRRICALMALGQFDFPPDPPPEFETREDAELWLAAKPPLILRLPRLSTADHNTIMGAAMADVTQMLAEARLISIRQNTLNFGLERAAHYRRYEVKVARDYLAKAILSVVQEAISNELDHNKQQVLGALLYVPLTDCRARNQALKVAMDAAMPRLRTFFANVGDNLVPLILLDLDNPASALVQGLPDFGLQPGVSEIPIFVRLYMDAAWGTSVDMLDALVRCLINQVGNEWVDAIHDASEVLRWAPADELTRRETDTQAETEGGREGQGDAKSGGPHCRRNSIGDMVIFSERRARSIIMNFDDDDDDDD